MEELSKEVLPPPRPFKTGHQKHHELGSSIAEACLTDDVKRLIELIVHFDLHLQEMIYFPHAGKMAPLTFAVKNNKFKAVFCFTSWGTRLNSVYVPGSTILHTACQNADLNIVKHLVDCGANLKALDDFNRTCLMVAVGKTDICKYLLEKGIEVNAQDKDRKTSLHHAVQQSYLESVKMLIAYGADVNLKDKNGIDAFHLSAVCNRTEIMDYLIRNTDLPVTSVVNGYCLLEAESLTKNDTKHALKMLDKATSVQCAQEWNINEETKLSEILNLGTEARTADDLISRSRDRESIVKQAFLIYQRILGGHHQKTASALRLLYQIVMDRKDYRNGSEILHYIYEEVLYKNPPFCFDCILAYQQLIKHIFSLSPDEIQNCRIFDLFKNLVFHIQLASQCLQKWSRDELQVYDRLMVDTVGVLITLSNIIIGESSRSDFYREVCRLVKIDPRGLNNVTLLHTLLNYDWKSIGFELAEPQSTTGLIKLLLDCGASVNATDDKRNTPLHTVLMCHGSLFGESLPDQDDVVKFLVERGTHMDSLNSRNQTVLSLMKAEGYQICEVQYLTLQCLAASAVIKNAIPYQDTVPKALIPFIKMHGKVETIGLRYVKDSCHVWQNT